MIREIFIICERYIPLDDINVKHDPDRNIMDLKIVQKFNILFRGRIDAMLQYYQKKQTLDFRRLLFSVSKLKRNITYFRNISWRCNDLALMWRLIRACAGVLSIFFMLGLKHSCYLSDRLIYGIREWMVGHVCFSTRIRGVKKLILSILSLIEICRSLISGTRTNTRTMEKRSTVMNLLRLV